MPGESLTITGAVTAPCLLRSPRSGELEKVMAISQNLSDALHRIVDHLPVREEQTALDLHAAINDEVDNSVSDPGVSYPESDTAATDE